MRKINNDTAAEKLKAIRPGHFFSVRFIKRTSCEVRDMLCRKGVTQFLSGDGRSFDPDEHNIMFVWDAGTFNTKIAEWRAENPDAPDEIYEAAHDKIGAQCYRSVNLESIITFTADGQSYMVNDFPMHNWRFDWVEAGTDHSRTVTGRTYQEAVRTLVRELKLKTRPRGTTCMDEGPVDGYEEQPLDLESQQGDLAPSFLVGAESEEPTTESPTGISEDQSDPVDPSSPDEDSDPSDDSESPEAPFLTDESTSPAEDSPTSEDEGSDPSDDAGEPESPEADTSPAAEGGDEDAEPAE